MLLLDVYNLLHAAPKVSPDLAGLDVHELARMVGASGLGATGALLICDGTGGRSARLNDRSTRDDPHAPEIDPREAEVRILYAGPGKDADTVIERRLDALEAKGQARRALVVSSDRRVQAAAVGVRAKWATSEDFLGALLRERQIRAKRDHASTGGKPAFARAAPLDPASTAWWMREFGIETPAIAPLPPITPIPPKSSSAAPPAKAPASAKPPPTPGPPAPAGTDPALLEALKEWAGRLSLDDLDMSKWLDPPPPPPPPTPPASPPPRAP